MCHRVFSRTMNPIAMQTTREIETSIIMSFTLNDRELQDDHSFPKENPGFVASVTRFQ
jgi:hypothetical protein